ncbi:hypothetical protein [Endozoicomonas sp. GU-1]|nr:hypothetical protein [Endozoicomonas sp. GU-1]WBA82571.1 hypothetical protein O2T12_05335 [Endozoicomonas sp. GU-1]
MATIKQFAQRASDCTCTCPDEFSGVWAGLIVAGSVPSAALGGFIGCGCAGKISGIVVGAPAGAGVGAVLTSCALIACHGCECVQLRKRQIATCTKQNSLPNGQQQSLKLPSAPPLLEAESIDAKCKTPVQSQPELMYPFLLSGGTIKCDPPVFLQPGIAGKKSSTGMCPAFCPVSQTGYV